MIVAFEMKLVCNYHEKEDPTGFENSDRNQESEEIAFGRIIINESYTEGWNMYQPKTKRI